MNKTIYALAALALCGAGPAGSTAPRADFGSDDQTPRLAVTLVEKDKHAHQKAATIQARARGVQIVDPASTQEKAARGQAHFHFRLDDGPVIATTSNKLSFHELDSGDHTVTVQLAGNDHQPLGP